MKTQTSSNNGFSNINTKTPVSYDKQIETYIKVNGDNYNAEIEDIKTKLKNNKINRNDFINLINLINKRYNK